MFYQPFLSPQVKRLAIITCKQGLRVSAVIECLDFLE